MDKEELKQFLLNNLPLAREAKSGEQIVCQCAVCSTPDTKGHCYIGPFDDSDSPIMYNCFRCDPTEERRKGVVNQEFLNRYQLWMTGDYGNNPNRSYIKKKRIGNRQVLDIANSIEDTRENRLKLQYINKRLGLQLTYQDLVGLKIFLNLQYLLNSNNIHRYSRDASIIQLLGSNFLGVLGVNNNMLSLRRLIETGLPNVVNKKYINYVVTDKIDAEKFYMMPNSVDMMKPVHIHIAEGFFDILGIFFNVMNCNTEQNLYIAGFGKSYEESLKFLVCNFPMLYTVVHLYPDLDVTDYVVRGICNNIQPVVNELYVHRNIYRGEGKQEKDFGVPREKIITSTLKI